MNLNKKLGTKDVLFPQSYLTEQTKIIIAVIMIVQVDEIV
jgi:hypothetical protein